MAGSFGCRDSHHWCGDSGIKTVSLSVHYIVLTRNITHNGRKFWLQRQPHWCGDSRIKTVSLSVPDFVLTRNITHNGRTFRLQRQPSLMWRFGNKKRFSISAWPCADQEYYPQTRNITQNGSKFWLQRQPSLMWRLGNKTVSLSVPDIVLTRNTTHNDRKFWLQRHPSLMWRFGNKNRFSISTWIYVDQEYYPQRQKVLVAETAITDVEIRE